MCGCLYVCVGVWMSVCVWVSGCVYMCMGVGVRVSGVFVFVCGVLECGGCVCGVFVCGGVCG